MIYVLMVFLYRFNGDAVSSLTQEFTTKEKCELAKTAYQGLDNYNYSIEAICVEK